MQKRSFLLIEILIAFTLIAICIIPIVKQPLKLYREEISNLEEIELERLADWSFTEVKELLLKNEISWKELPKKGKKTKSYDLPSINLDIPGMRKTEIQRSFILTGRGEKTGLNQEIYKQLGVYIFLNNKKYSYRLPVQKLSFHNNEK